MSLKVLPKLANSNNCFNCDCELGFWRGKFRHHCRACGNSFCYDCAQNVCELPEFGVDKKVRVCNTCFQTYNTHEIENDEEEEEEEEDDDIYYDIELISSHDVPNTIEENDYDSIPEPLDDQQINEETEASNFDGIAEESEDCSIIEHAINMSLIQHHEDRQTEAIPVDSDERQLAIALALSKIEDKIKNYASSKDEHVMSEEEALQFALRLSECEERAKEYVTATKPLPPPTVIEDDEELQLALVVSQIEANDLKNVQPECSTATTSHTREHVQCPICFDGKLEYALIVCGHVVCGECKPKLSECPICRAQILGAIRVYINN